MGQIDAPTAIKLTAKVCHGKEDMATTKVVGFDACMIVYSVVDQIKYNCFSKQEILRKPYEATFIGNTCPFAKNISISAPLFVCL